MNGLMSSQMSSQTGSPLLSQAEVDALLQGPHGAGEALGGAGSAGFADEDQAGHPLTQTERHWRARLPALERIHQRFAQLLREALPALLRRQPELEVGAVQVQSFSAFLREVAVPTNFNVVSFKPLRGHGLIVCDPALVFAVVDAMFGGNGKFQTRLVGRDFSATEQRVIQRLMAVVLGPYAKAWAELLPLEPTWVRSDMLPPAMSIAAANDLVVSTTFGLEVGDARCTLTVCLPCALLEPVRAQLLATPAGPAQAAVDPRWMDQLKQEIQAAEVELVAELAQGSATVQQLMRFKPGDFIELDLHPQVRAQVNGVPILEGHYGISNNRYAIKVEHLIQHAGQPWLTEKQHAQ
jgi:flagellar motor switch protein FliM